MGFCVWRGSPQIKTGYFLMHSQSIFVFLYAQNLKVFIFRKKSNSIFLFSIKTNILAENAIKVCFLTRFFECNCSGKIFMRQHLIITQDVIHLLVKRKALFDSKSLHLSCLEISNFLYKNDFIKCVRKFC